MVIASAISEEEYLRTAFDPDCDFIDGVVEDRNLGQWDHSSVQYAVLLWFHKHRAKFQIHARPELRVRVGEGRYRVPDVCVVLTSEPRQQVLTVPPKIAIEILSPEDTVAKLRERFDDYLLMGIENIWVIDPQSTRAWRVTVEGQLEARDRVLRTADGTIEMLLDEVFAIATEE